MFKVDDEVRHPIAADKKILCLESWFKGREPPRSHQIGAYF